MIEDKNQVERMTIEQRRTRLAEIRMMAKHGDFSWSMDELVRLEQSIPEEKKAIDDAEAKRTKSVLRRRKSLGM